MENNKQILSGIKNVKDSAKSLPEQVAEQIRQLIIDQHLETGAKLPNEFELAQQLNVGRGSVREAVKLLVARNVLELQRGKGTFVAGNTGMVDDPFGFAYMEDEARLAVELLQLRRQLEPWVAALAAQQASEEDIQALRNCQLAIEEAIAAGEDDRPADQNFHICIANCTGNRVLPMLLPVITYSMHLANKLGLQLPPEEIIKAHTRIADAIAAHDPWRARAAMEKHLWQLRLPR